MISKKLLIVIAVPFIAATQAAAGDIQSYTPMTRAGGAYVPPDTLFDTAVTVEKGSEGITRRSYSETQTVEAVTLVPDENGDMRPKAESIQTIVVDP